VIVRRSHFADTRICHHLKSRAARTEVTDSALLDGPESNTSYLVDTPNGGDLLLRGNRLVKGPRTDNPLTAVTIGAEGVRHPTDSLVIEDNHFINRLSLPLFFVFNRSNASVRLARNRLDGLVVPIGRL